MNKGIKWLVITTQGIREFTSTEYMTNYIKKREDIIISIAHATVNMEV